MKFMTKSTAIVAALAMATTGVLAFSTKVNAATVATVHSGVVARLYTPQGAKISNRALSPNSAWQVGKILTINGEKMYQVSTNEYLRAADSSLNGQQQSHAPRLAGKAMSMLALYRDDTNSMANRSLAPNSEWAIGKYVVNKNGQQFVQVSTHEYADASKLMYTQPMTNPTYIADFGTNTKFSDFAVVGSGNLGTNGDSSSATDTTPSVTVPDVNTNSNNSSKDRPVASVASIQSAVVKSINDARASKGSGPVVLDSVLTKIAMKRAHESVTNFTHIRADGNHWYAELKQVAPSYAARGENLFLTPWDDLSVETPEQLAYVMMDNFRGEGEGSETDMSKWTHYTGMLDSKAGKVGVGVYVTSDKTVYIAEDFAK